MPVTVAADESVTLDVVGAVEKHKVSVVVGVRPAEAPPLVSDQLPLVDHAELDAPVQ